MAKTYVSQMNESKAKELLNDVDLVWLMGKALKMGYSPTEIYHTAIQVSFAIKKEETNNG